MKSTKEKIIQAMVLIMISDGKIDNEEMKQIFDFADILKIDKVKTEEIIMFVLGN